MVDCVCIAPAIGSQHLPLMLEILLLKGLEFLLQVHTRPLALLGEVDVVNRNRVVDLNLSVSRGSLLRTVESVFLSLTRIGGAVISALLASLLLRHLQTSIRQVLLLSLGDLPRPALIGLFGWFA